jgi:hypothetical protein
MMRRLRFASAALIPAFATGLMAEASNSLSAETIEQKPSEPCGTYDASTLDPKPDPSVDGWSRPARFDRQKRVQDTRYHARRSRPPTGELVQPSRSPEQAKEICEKYFTAVYLDWSGVPYNLAMRSRAKAIFSALGI